jgi:uncharacterized membrane protein
MTTVPTVPASNHGVLKKVGWSVMLVFALLMFLMASRYLLFDPEKVYFEPQKAVYFAHRFGILTHICGAMLAIILGPSQFLPQIITRRYLKLHRWLGRIYLLGVLFGGLGGLYMSFLAYGGLPARLGFGLLAFMWLLTGLMAYRQIRRKDIQSHRQWMVRNYALTFAAVILRLWLIIFEVAGVEFIEAYITVAWLAWVPNLLIAEWMVNRIKPIRRSAATLLP